MAFIGRWSPLHVGHTAIIEIKLKEHPKHPVLIMIRDTDTDVYPVQLRAEYIKIWMIKRRIKGTIMIIPNIEGIYWGRKVGYNIGQIDVDKKIENISGTKIRNEITRKTSRWQQDVADQKTSLMLSPKVSRIIDKGLVIWLTGCPSSGKTTIAKALITYTKKRYPYIKYQLLDGDDMRSSPMAKNVGFSKSDRRQHLQKMAYLASMLANHGILVICAFVSPYKAFRNEAQRIVGNYRYKEVYVRASKKIRIQRDTKGLYQQAAAGQLKQMTGYNDVYEIPINPTVQCNTDMLTVEQCVSKITRVIFNE